MRRFESHWRTALARGWGDSAGRNSFHPRDLSTHVSTLQLITAAEAPVVLAGARPGTRAATSLTEVFAATVRNHPAAVAVQDAITIGEGNGPAALPLIAWRVTSAGKTPYGGST